MAVPDPEKMTFEQAIEELESIIGRVEQGKIGLAESLAEYQRGAALLKRCRGTLEVAEQQIEKLSVEQAGESASK
jgi:exodeoxyribonuclease VII small subunit